MRVRNFGITQGKSWWQKNFEEGQVEKDGKEKGGNENYTSTHKHTQADQLQAASDSQLHFCVAFAPKMTCVVLKSGLSAVVQLDLSRLQ